MQIIKLLKIPGDWKDPLYISRNVYKSAFHEGSPPGISRSVMGALNIWFCPLSLTSCLSTCTTFHRGCGVARQPALETQQGKGNYRQQGRTQHDWGAPSQEISGVHPKGCMKHIPKDAWTLKLWAAEAPQKPKAGPQGHGGQMSTMRYSRYYYSVFDLQSGSCSPTTRSSSNKNTSSSSSSW